MLTSTAPIKLNRLGDVGSRLAKPVAEPTTPRARLPAPPDPPATVLRTPRQQTPASARRLTESPFAQPAFDTTHSPVAGPSRPLRAPSARLAFAEHDVDSPQKPARPKEPNSLLSRGLAFLPGKDTSPARDRKPLLDLAAPVVDVPATQVSLAEQLAWGSPRKRTTGRERCVTVL